MLVYSYYYLIYYKQFCDAKLLKNNDIRKKKRPKRRFFLIFLVFASYVNHMNYVSYASTVIAGRPLFYRMRYTIHR